MQRLSYFDKKQDRFVDFESPYSDGEAYALCRRELEARENDFLRKLCESCEDYLAGGRPQQRWQHSWMHLIAKQVAAKEELRDVALNGLSAFFTRLYEKGARRFSLRLTPELRLSLAGSRAAIPGSITMYGEAPNAEKAWFGRIVDGELRPAREFLEHSRKEHFITCLRQADASPQEYALLYGRETGECAVCGAALTDPKSIALGIGPKCGQKIGVDFKAAPKQTPLSDVVAEWDGKTRSAEERDDDAPF